MDMGLMLLAMGGLCCVAPVALFLILGRRKAPEPERYFRKQVGQLLLVLCIPVWLFALKVHGLDEGLVNACFEQDIPRIRWLLRLGADPDCSFEGRTPLGEALASENQEIVDIIWEAGGRDRGEPPR